MASSSPSRLRGVLPFVALLGALSACGGGPSFRSVMEQGTPEAYEAWFKTADPKDADFVTAYVQLEKILFDKALVEGSIEAFDRFFARYPAKKHASYPQGFTPMYFDKAWKEREAVLWSWADQQNSREAFARFLEDYPNAGKKRKAEGRRRVHMLDNLDKLRVGPVRQERVNLAENPEGALDGWGFWVEVTNVGDKPIERCSLAIYYLGDGDRVLDRDEWPVVAKRLPGNLPFAEGFDKPMAPGETRTWEWTTGETADGWSQRVRITPVDILFVGEAGSDKLAAED
jgi:tetratricopeptide (TPR) repeat protein